MSGINKYLKQIILLGFWLLLVFARTSQADVLSIPGVENDTEMLLPSRGMTMDVVNEKFGKPNEVIDPVGTPPITRWIYQQFTVHFEYEYVIHAVKNRRNSDTPE